MIGLPAGAGPEVKTMKRFWRKYGFAVLAISPFFIQFFIFQLAPTAATIWLSFQKWNGMSEPQFIGLGNYRAMLTDYQFLDALRNTAIYWLVGVVGVLSLSLLLACMLNSKLLRGRRFFKTAVFLPYVCASIAVGLIFGMLFDQNAGLINAILGLAGADPQPWLTSSSLARIPVHALFIWRMTPWYVLIYLSGLLGIPGEYYEAATVDGAAGIQQFFRITLPQLGNISFFCMVTVTVDAWKIFNESYTLAGPGSSNMSLFQLMYVNAFQIFKMGYGSAVGVVLIVILLALSLVQFYVRHRRREL